MRDVGRGLPAADLGRRVEAQQLLDRVVDEIVVIAKERALSRMVGEGDEGIAQHPRHRLVSGEEQEGDHGDDLVVVEVVAAVAGGECRDQIRSGLVATRRDHAPEVDVELAESFAHRVGIERGQRFQHSADLTGGIEEPRSTFGR